MQFPSLPFMSMALQMPQFNGISTRKRSREQSGSDDHEPTASGRTLAAQMAQMGASLPPTATAAPHASAPQASAVPVLTPDALAEIEMARQRAERARRSKEVKLEPAEHHVRPEDGPGESEDPEALTPEEQEMLAASGHDGEKDVRKLKRLLRNRVSAQQARERKKQYVGQLEEEVRNKQERVEELEVKLKEVQGQNETLRRIIRTMKPPAQAGEAAAALSKLHNRLPLQARGKQQHMQAQAQTQTNGNEQAANEQARAEGGGQDAAPAAVST